MPLFALEGLFDNIDASKATVRHRTQLTRRELIRTDGQLYRQNRQPNELEMIWKPMQRLFGIVPTQYIRRVRDDSLENCKCVKVEQ